ncbi:sigma-70 family RNA polymerase sigma factor [Paraburkholderia terrae]|uniref:Sigma-70 family RNA polymerase sigma factor n=2 Tax=Paraburkholderia terrae TaxID=311230 RepID=A0A2I8EZD5_9BURK|nr:sigma-70 family RNA polymerase sigma factor [Paraburkholderia terrae]
MFLGTLVAVPRPPATSGAVAPRSQVESAIAGLADRDFAVLQYEAERICRKYRELSPDDAGDLLQDAFQAVIEARRYWQPANVAFVPFLIGVMQSLAHNYHKHMKGSHSVNVTYEHQLPPTEDGSSTIDSIAVEGHASAEETVSDLQELALVEAGISILRAQLAQHPLSLAIFDGLLDGKEKKQIREELNVEWTAFWSADRRLTRAIEAYKRSI